MAYKGNRPIKVLFPDQLGSYSLTGFGDIPRISKAEIEDKSKGDAISKAAVILQVGWFVMQCIARVVQGLPLTELELVTLAFAALNFAIYVLWWDKPQNVGRGVRVYKKMRTRLPVDDGYAEATVGFWAALLDALFGLPAAVVRGPRRREHEREQWWLYRVVVWPIRNFIQLMGFGDYESYREYWDSKRISPFYPDEWVETKFDAWSFVFSIAIACAFGGIHCIGWSFAFPTNMERTLWRVASLSIAVLPYAICLLLFCTPQEELLRITCCMMTWILLVFFYIFCRLALLVLPFVCLRSLPPEVYHVVRWTSFVPHV